MDEKTNTNSNGDNGNTSREIVDHPTVSDLITKRGSDGVHLARISPKRGADVRYEVAFPMPLPDDVKDYESVVNFLREFYQNAEENPDGSPVSDADLVGYALSAMVMNISVKPDFKSVGFDENGNLAEKGHKLMQDLADNAGIVPQKRTRATTTATKAKAQKADSLETVMATINGSELSAGRKQALCGAVANKLFAGAALTEKDAADLEKLGVNI